MSETIPHTPEDKLNKEGAKEQVFQKLVFETPLTAREYLAWKAQTPPAFRKIVEAGLMGKALKVSQTGLPLTDIFFEKFVEKLVVEKSENPPPEHQIIDRFLEKLHRIKSGEGFLDAFKTLLDKNSPWSLRQVIYKNKIAPIIDWLTKKDLDNIQKEIEEKLKEEESKDDAKEGESGQQEEKETGSGEDDNDIPPETDDASSSLESSSGNQEGTPKALYTIYPSRSGYYKTSPSASFDAKTGKWLGGEKVFSPAKIHQIDPTTARVVTGKVKAGRKYKLPLQDGFVVQADTDTNKTSLPKLYNDENGATYFEIPGRGKVSYSITVGQRLTEETVLNFKESEIEGKLPKELLDKIEEIKKSDEPPMKKARSLAGYIYKHLQYETKNPELWKQYMSSGRFDFEKVWAEKRADCFVANTIGVLASQKLGEVPACFMSGYLSKEKDGEGRTVLNSQNGHGWQEVYDKESQRVVKLDVTPKGDPNIDQEKQEQELSEGGEEGDEGDNGEDMSDGDELASEESVRDFLGEDKDNKDSLPEFKPPEYSTVESSFAKNAECSLEEAREFLEAQERVRKIKDKRGVPISKKLLDEWKKIVSERKVSKDVYQGPVRMSEGEDLEDETDAFIDIKSGDFDPTGFQKQREKKEQESDFGGINIFFEFDLSGSMAWEDKKTGRRKVDVQRDVALLFVDSLMQASFVYRRDGQGSDLLPIKISVALSRDQTIKMELPLTDKWGPKEQVVFWKALNKVAGGGTPSHEALAEIESSLKEELKRNKDLPEHKKPINYVVETSDGEPTKKAETKAKRKDLRDLGAFVRSFVIGTTGTDEETVLESFSDLSDALSQDILTQFAKLHPKRVKLK